MTKALVLVVERTREDAVSGALWDLGCTGVTIEAAGMNVRVQGFFDDAEAVVAGARRLALEHGGTFEEAVVPDVDWVATFRETFRAFDVGSFRIVPEWDRSSPPERTAIVVDPGRAFGTGTHESTRLCLEAFERIAPALRPRPRVLDLGCGTSILAIGAAKRTGARPVACDIDPEAVASTRRHAELNGVAIDALVADGARAFQPGRFDLVFANLMAPLLVARASEIAAMLAPAGRAILAGLLAEEAPGVAASWPAGYGVVRSDMGEWSCLTLTRPV